MAFTAPITDAEGRCILGWHDVGLSHRDMRELMEADVYPGPVRSAAGIRQYLRLHDREPHPAVRGPNPDGAQTHCSSEDFHPGETVARSGAHMECPRCKAAKEVQRRARRNAGLRDAIARLRALGGEAAEIGDWIEAEVHPR